MGSRVTFVFLGDFCGFTGPKGFQSCFYVVPNDFDGFWISVGGSPAVDIVLAFR